MKRMLTVAAALGAVMLLTDSDVRGGGKGGKTDLEGKWSVTEVNVAGKKEGLPPGGMTFTVKGDKWAMSEGGKAAHEGTLKVNAAKTPKQIDLTKQGEKGIAEGIYEVKGDTAQIALPVEAPKGKRPAGFDAKGTVILHLKRAK